MKTLKNVQSWNVCQRACTDEPQCDAWYWVPPTFSFISARSNCYRFKIGTGTQKLVETGIIGGWRNCYILRTLGMHTYELQYRLIFTFEVDKR